MISKRLLVYDVLLSLKLINFPIINFQKLIIIPQYFIVSLEMYVSRGKPLIKIIYN